MWLNTKHKESQPNVPEIVSEMNSFQGYINPTVSRVSTRFSVSVSDSILYTIRRIHDTCCGMFDQKKQKTENI